MAVRYVVDTNLLVYTLDRREPKKRGRAREVLRGASAVPEAQRSRLRSSPSSRARA